jgi:gliding motility-associated-like protein
VGPTYGGGIADGFVAKISGDGSSVIKSTYIGTTGTDQIYGIQEDRNGFVYVMGTNTGGSNTNFPIRNAAFSEAGGKQFIAKMQSDFSAYVYSTVFGTASGFPNISPTAFLVDRCENVYVSGWGGSMGGQTPYQNSGTSGMTVTPDAIDNTTDGKDFYFIVIEKDAARQLYGTFFGQQDPPNSGTPDHVDGGTSRFDPQGVIYQGICANCSPGQFPTTPGVVAPSKPAGAICNLAVIKINFDLSGVASGIKSSIDGVDGDTSACAPTLVNFRDTIGIAQTYQWDFGDGSPEITTNSPNTSYSYSNAGTYRVRLIAIDLTRCFPRDTSYVNIRVRTDRVNVGALATKLDPCNSNTYRFDNLSTVIPAKPFSDTSFSWIFGDNSAPVKANNRSITHQFPAPGTYRVRLVLTDTNYCNAPDTFAIVLRVSPEVVADFEVQSPGCAPYTAEFNNTSAGGQTFHWDFGNGQTSTAINPTAFYATPGSYTIRLIARDPSTCNLIDTSFRVIEVLSKIQAAFTFSPNPSEENIPTTFTNNSQLASQYKWIFGDGEELITFQRDTIVRHQYRQSGTFNVCLITINEIGCNDTLCIPVEAFVDPLIDVVTAFTPNNDGVNDRAAIIGFGVVKLSFKIFNRWGQLMFETSDVQQGWDGNFKGKPQPMDAYGYTLDAELLTGQKLRKAGSITLIR